MKIQVTWEIGDITRGRAVCKDKSDGIIASIHGEWAVIFINGEAGPICHTPQDFVSWLNSNGVIPREYAA